MTALFDPIRGYANWALRLPFAGIFLLNGWQKFSQWPAFPEMMSGGGEATLIASLIAGLVLFAEVAAGIGIIAGIFLGSTITRLSGLAIIPVMIGALVLVHLPAGFDNLSLDASGIGLPSWEFNVTMLAVALFFLISGNTDSEA